MRGSFVLAAVWLTTALAAAEGPVVIGNGRLTAAVASDGRIVSVTWPQPGLYEQLGADGMAPADEHAVESVERIAPGALRLSGSRLPAGDDWSVLVYIPADTDVLIIEAVSGEPPRWIAGLSPMPSGVPGLPGAKKLFPGLGGLAAVRHGDAHFAFRTEGASSREAERIGELTANETTLTQWNRLGDGVWIALDGVVDSPDPAASVLTLQGAAVRAAFGRNANGAYDALNRARGLNADSAPPAPEGLRMPADPAKAALARQALHTLLAVQAIETGAMARRPWAAGGDAHDWPRDGAWTIAALRLAGVGDRADRQLAFYGAAIESEAEPDGPFGSMPAALQAGGLPAFPPYIRDIEGPARFLWAAAQSAEAGSPLTDEIRAAAVRAMAFLTDWAHPVSRLPLAGYDPAMKRDRAAASQIPPLAAGLEAGIRLLTQQHPEAERWIRRLTEADALARSECFDESGAATLDDPLAFLDTPVLTGAAAEAVGEALLGRIVTDGEIDWAAAYGAVSLLPAGKRDAVWDLVEPFAATPGTILGDTRAAAWAYLALMRLEP